MTMTVLPGTPRTGKLSHIVQVREYGRILVPAHIPFTLADRVALQELNLKLKPDAFLVTDTREGPRLQASQFVGVFTLPSFTLHVEPKSETPAQNLLFMLLRAQTSKVTLQHAWQDIETVGSFVEYVARLFIRHLREQMSRGLIRQSQLVQEDSPRLRGRLRVAPYLRRRDPTRLPVQYPDLTANLPMNQLFAAALTRILHSAVAGQVRGEAAELLAWLSDAGVRPLQAIPRRLDQFKLNRLQERYRLTLDLAWLVLNGMVILPTPGQTHTDSFTFDMDRVLERFLERVLIEDVLRGTELKGLPQGKTPYGKPEYLFKTVQRLEPDLVLWKGNQARLIIDVKNKRPNGQVSREDLYQMYAYARHLKCQRVLLLYPGSVTIPALHTTNDPVVQITSAGVNLSGSLASATGYEALVKELKALLSEQGVFE